MKKFSTLLLGTLLTAGTVSLHSQYTVKQASDEEAAAAAAAAAHKPKNWKAPADRILGQKFVDEIMASHPELLSITLHAVPPGTEVHTMFAGSFPDRIGNADDPDDIDAAVKALTVLDPRLDRRGRFVVFIPMKDSAGQFVGSVVIGFKADEKKPREPMEYYKAALVLQKDLQKLTPTLADLFKPAQ